LDQRLLLVRFGVFFEFHRDFLRPLVLLTRTLSVFRRIVVAVGAGLDFFFFGAGSYLADFSAPTRNRTRLAPPTIYVLWFELNLKSFSPLFRYLPFPFNIFRLSRFERSTFVAVQSTIGDHFRHDFVYLPFRTYPVLSDAAGEISVLQSHDVGTMLLKICQKLDI